MADIFVSYAREDQAFAKRIAEGVAREGYSVWWDDDLPPHLSYGDVITEKIGGAKAAIVVWSRHAAESEWVRAEADLARQQRKLIQTSIDDRQPPMPFNQIQFASIGDWQGEPNHSGWNKVKTSLAALAGGAGAATERTAPTAPIQPAPVTSPPSARAASSGPNWAVAVLIGALVVAGGVGGGWYLLRDSASAEVEEGKVVPETADATSPSPPGQPGSRPATAAFTDAATIDSPDGFMNVRSGPSAGFPVVARVNQGQVFTTFRQNGEWWQVRTADSRVGYMHSRYIRLIDAQAASAGADDTAAPDEGLAEPVSSTPAQTTRVAAHDDPPQIFPDSSRRRLTPAEIAGLSPGQIRLARNEIFARHGRAFQDPGLRRHFARYSWYAPRPTSSALNGVEQANVRLLRQAEAK